MSYSKVFAAQASLLGTNIIDVEVDLSRGLHAFAVVGLADQATEEAKDRISAAIKNSGFDSPKGSNKKIVISLAPAELSKEGAGLDLSMALGYMLASGEVGFEPNGKIFIGELSLDGATRQTRGILPATREGKKQGFKEIFVPRENAEEAALISGISVYAVSTLKECVDHLTGIKKLSPQPLTKVTTKQLEIELDFSDIKGQESAKRALEIAAAGGHNAALYGPPGTGKTMLARGFRSILPALTFDEMLEVTEIHSVAGLLNQNIVTERPFRSPHHTSSYVAMVGGGAVPRPGEITLSHRGVLFLDEFPEFDMKTIQSLRQPLEDRVISVSRARGSVRFPAHFTLVASMNPCPCGNFGVKDLACVCTPQAIMRYKKKLSGPIVDRIDIWTEVAKVDHDKLTEKSEGSESREIILRVNKARAIQAERFGTDGKVNGDMSAKDLVNLITLRDEVKDLLNQSARALNMSGRSYHKIIKVARTIADLASAPEIERDHLLEALSYRPKSQQY